MSIVNDPNIILIVIDALRVRNLGCYGMEGNPSPHIDEIAEQGILFENAYACWNTTDQSLTSIMSGKYPRSHGIMNHGDKVTREERKRFTQTNTKLIAEILRESCYQTMAVDWMGRWFKRGFDDYGYQIKRNGLKKLVYYSLNLPKLYLKYVIDHLPILKCYTPLRKLTLKDIGKGIKDLLSTFAFTYHLAQLQDAALVTQIADEFIRRSHVKPSFLFLHYWDTHTPYHCPRENMDKKNKILDAKSLLMSRYHGAVNYVDFQLGKLFVTLKQHNLWENTLIIITSDHGDSLTEHDIYFDHHGLYEETTHVPLIIHYPGYFTNSKRVHGFVQHIDLVPTIYDILQIKYPNQLDGQSLLPLILKKISKIRDHVFMEESYVQKKTALRTDLYKYIIAIEGNGWCNYCQRVHVGKEELYDLMNDPHEMVDISAENESIVQAMKHQLEEIVETLDKKREDTISKNKGPNEKGSDDYDTDEEAMIRKLFKNMGYLAK